MSLQFTHALRLIAKIFFLSLFIGLLFLILNLSIKDQIQIPSDVSIWYMKQVFDGKAPTIKPKILIVGDSVASTGLNPSILGLGETLSLSPWGASPAEMLKILEKYTEDFGAPKCLIIDYSYLPQKYRVNLFWLNFVKNGYFSKTEFDQIIQKSFELKSFLTTNENKLSLELKFFLYSNFGSLMDYDGFRLKPEPRFKKLMEYTLNNNGHTLDIKSIPLQFERQWQQDIRSSPFQPSPFADYYLYLMGQKAKSLGVKLFLIRAPFFPEVINSSSNRSTLIESQDHIYEVFRSTGVEIDYISAWPKLNQSHFFDSWHLNKIGAEVYTQWLKERILCP